MKNLLDFFKASNTLSLRYPPPRREARIDGFGLLPEGRPVPSVMGKRQHTEKSIATSTIAGRPMIKVPMAETMIKSQTCIPHPSRVIWITGLSASGKTTLALALVERLKQCGHTVIMLDGDQLREVFGAVVSNEANHGRDGRLALAMQYAHLCRIIASQGVTLVIATISMFKEVHTWNRHHLPGYYEIYLKVPMEELRRRDPKGLYQRYDAGELKNMAGLDLAVDEPEHPNYLVEFMPDRAVGDLAEEIMNHFMETPSV